MLRRSLHDGGFNGIINRSLLFVWCNLLSLKQHLREATLRGRAIQLMGIDAANNVYLDEKALLFDINNSICKCATTFTPFKHQLPGDL